MKIDLSHLKGKFKAKINLTASKSESNRALIIRELCIKSFKINNLAEAEDTKVLQKLLKQINHPNFDAKLNELNVHLAGTSMRFLTALLSIKLGSNLLTGEQRMKERPIKVLVDALKTLGADIKYTENKGFPPLLLNGQQLKGGKIVIDGSVSSQYISALMMIAPVLKNGLQIQFDGKIISKPYIDMTVQLMRYFGAELDWDENVIQINESAYQPKEITIEADWSSASYWYGFAALAKKADIVLLGLKKDSWQGDAVVAEIYKNFGVTTEFIEGGVRLTKSSNFQLPIANFQFDFTNCPDIAQTVAVTSAALNLKAKLTGLTTLRIKETDRIDALHTELNKLGFNVEVDGDDLMVQPSLRVTACPGVISGKQSYAMNDDITSLHSVPFVITQPIKTYNDHRMAMAFAPLTLFNEITIENPDVVKKSYPMFWDDVEKLKTNGNL